MSSVKNVTPGWLFDIRDYTATQLYGHCRNGNLKIPLKSPSRLVGCLIYTLQDFHGWAETFKSPVLCKENDLNQTSMKKFQPLIFRGVGDEMLPNYMGSIEWQSKDPSQKAF